MSAFFDDDEVHTLVILPPDGGWGYMVVFSSFICHFVIDGSIYTFGLFLDPICKAFGTTMAQVSLVGSVLNGVCYFVGPFASACVNRFDFRLVAISGCIVAALGYLMSAYSVNYPMYLVGNGLILGLGYGMLYVPALISPSLYFAKYRAIAVSMATCGTGIGTFVVPFAVTYLIETVGWRYTYLCMIGAVGVAALFSLSFIPLQPKRVYTRGDKNETDSKVFGTSKMNFRQDKRKRCLCCRWGNTYFPATTDIVEKHNASFEDLDMDQFSEMSSIITGRSAKLSKQSIVEQPACYKCMSFLCCACCQTQSRAMYRDDIFYAGSVLDVGRNRGKPKAKLTEKQMEQRKKKAAAKAQAAAAKAAKVAKEVQKMKEEAQKQPKATTSYQTEDTLNDYHMKVTRVTTAGELFDKFTCCCACACTVSGMRALSSLLDFRIMKSVAFIILCVNGFFYTLGYNIPFIFIIERATEAGIERNTAILYVCYIGIANTVARLVVGLIPILLNVNCTVIIVVCCILQGVCTICSDLYMTHWYQTLYVVAYGFLAAPYLALRSVLVVDIFGLENLTNIFGLQLVTSGIAGMVGPTVGGLLRDITNNYTYSFYFSGACITFSALLLAFIQPARQWETRTGYVHF